MPSVLLRLRASRMVRSTSAMMLTRGLSILIGVTLSVLLARWLAPEGYGAYLFTLTMAQFLAMPILAGLPTLVTREVANARGSGDANDQVGIIRWSIGFVLLTFLIVAAVFIALILFREQSENTLSIYYLALPLVLALAFLRVGSAIVQGYEHPFAGSLGDGLIRPALLLVLVAAIAAAGVLTPAKALMLHMAAATAAAMFAFGYWLFLCRDSRGSRPVTPHYRSREWFASLVPLGLVTAAALLNSRLDILMLGVLSADKNVGLYGIAIQLAGLVVMGQTIVNSIVAPKIARLYTEGSRSELNQLITQAARFSSLIALAVFAFVLLLGEQLIDGLLGHEYSESWAVALILCASNLVCSAMGPVTPLMTMTKNERTMARLFWFTALLNMILNVALIPTYGVFGAAIATVISQLIRHVLMTRWSAVQLHIDTTILGRVIA